MSNYRNIQTFHKRAQELRKKLGNQKEAWEQTEREFQELEGHTRYQNYKSFRQVHWQVITGNYRHLNK